MPDKVEKVNFGQIGPPPTVTHQHTENKTESDPQKSGVVNQKIQKGTLGPSFAILSLTESGGSFQFRLGAQIWKR